MSYFLLTQDAFDEYHAARDQVHQTTKEAIEFATTVNTSDDFSVERGIDSATVTIAGIMTKKPDFWAWLTVGNTAYSEVIPALEELDRDETVSSVQIKFDTPGGAVDGLRDLIMTIRGMKTKTIGVASGLTASAGFIAFSECDERVAANDSVLLGSMGVVQQFRVRKDIIAVTSTQSSKKVPDPTTDQGKADIRAELDKIYNFYGAFVADRMGVSVDQLPEKTDHGAVMLAGEALERGMLDSIEEESTISGEDGPESPGVESSTFSQEVVDMTPEQLKSEHRGVYDAIYGKGLDAGVSQERERVSAHITSGNACGAIDKALEAVKGGDPYTATSTAEYNAVLSAKLSQQAKKGGEAESAEAAAGAQAEPETPEQVEAKNTEAARSLLAKKLGAK